MAIPKEKKVGLRQKPPPTEGKNEILGVFGYHGTGLKRKALEDRVRELEEKEPTKRRSQRPATL